MARIKVGSRRIYVEEYGKGNARAIVFFHGGPGAGCEGFVNQATALGEKFHVVLFDQYGALRSGAIPAKEPFGMMDHVRLIDGMREALGIGSWAVLGHSYGGMLACLYAYTCPERTDAVIYECTAWDVDNKQRAHVNARRKTAVHCRKIREEGLIYQSFRPYLNEIDLPSLLLTAKHDSVCGEDARGYFLRNAPKGSTYEFQDSGHFPHLEEPEAFTKAVTNFLA